MRLRRSLLVTLLTGGFFASRKQATAQPRQNAPRRTGPRSGGQAPQPMERIQRAITQRLSQYVGVGKDKAPAIAVGLVTEKGELAFGLGTRVVGGQSDVGPDTLFAIGSLSKVFTGMALAKAVAEGDVSLNDKANKWLDKGLQIDDRITLEHLVSHRSGLPDFPENIGSRASSSANAVERQIMPGKDYSLQDLEDCIGQGLCRPKTTPGTDYAYSNLGIGLLSIALQNRFKYSDAEELNEKKITRSLDMDKTSMNESAFVGRNSSNIAQGYRIDKNSRSLVPTPLPDMGVLAGAGELISSVNDMNALLKELTGLEKGYSAAAREMNRNLSGSGMGYAHRLENAPGGGVMHSKSGFTAGYTATMYWRDNPRVGIVLLSNRGNFKTLVQIGKKLLNVTAEQMKRAN